MRKLLFISILLAACGGEGAKEPTPIEDAGSSAEDAGSEAADVGCILDEAIPDNECEACLIDHCCAQIVAMSGDEAACANMWCDFSCFECTESPILIGKNQVCDGSEDCADGSDEDGC